MEKSTIYGTITSAFYGSTKFSKEDMYRISIKINKENRDKLAEACAEMYKDSPDSFIPKWFKDPDAEYINFKSKFDINALYDGDKNITKLSEFLAEYGNINGSNVGIAVKLDKGSIYPLAIKIYELKTTDFSDLFDETELPF